MTAPYLTADQFADRFGTLDDGQEASAKALVQVVSDWIRGQKPDADPTAAAQVVFEVVRDSLNLAEFSPLKQFENSTSRRTTSGTFADGDGAALLSEVITDRQKRLLGIALRAAPAYNFPVNDLAMPHESYGVFYSDGYPYRLGPYC